MEVKSLYREPERAPEQIDWPALEHHDVFKIYRSGPVETVALRGLDLRVERGESVAVFGPSGSGKSTFLALSAGLDQPSAGEVRAFGRSLTRAGESGLAAFRAREMAIVFQSDNLWSGLTVQQNVEIALQLAGREDPAGDAVVALESFGLGARRSHRAAALSGGEQQRVAIAAAAARRSPLVLADEPTGQLDRANERIVLEALSELRNEYGSTLVLVTHSSRVAAAADRVIELRNGKVLG